jgi:hypothetical protein
MLLYTTISSHAFSLAGWRFHSEKLEVLVAAQTLELGLFHAKANVLEREIGAT